MQTSQIPRPKSCHPVSMLPRCRARLTRDVAAHIFDVHFMQPDLSGGVSDRDRAILVVHNLRCGRLPGRHVDLSYGRTGRQGNEHPRHFPWRSSVQSAKVAFRSEGTPCCLKHPRQDKDNRKTETCLPLFCSLFLPQNAAGNSSKGFSTFVLASEKLKLD